MDNKVKIWGAFLDYLVDHAGQPPTMRQIAEMCGISSTSVVSHHVDTLIDEGWLVKIDDEKGYSRNITIPGGWWTPPGSEIKWEIVAVPIVDDIVTLYFLRYGTGVRHTTLLYEILSTLVTKIVLDQSSNTPLTNMVRLPVWAKEQLDSEGYINSDQALAAGVLPSGKAPENEGSWVREGYRQEMAQSIQESEKKSG